MADQVHRTLPSVFPYCFSFAHMLPPSVDIYHRVLSPPSPPHSLSSPFTPTQMRFKRVLNGIFQLPHDPLSPRCVFHGCWATQSPSQSASVPPPAKATQRLRLRHALLSAVNGTPAATNGTVVMPARVCCMRQATRQRNQALTPRVRVPGGGGC